jgi:hypothetical protein
MMTVALPKPIELYFASENGRDIAGTDSCFAADATVRDEGKTMKGLAEIKAWRMEPRGRITTRCCRCRDHAGRQGGRERQVSGTFPGSPITLDQTLELAGDRRRFWV